MNAYRGRVEVPINHQDRVVDLGHAMGENLAEQYGLTVTGIDSEQSLHELFLSQGEKLLENSGEQFSASRLDWALRILRKAHKHEAAFWQPAENTVLAETPTAQVLVPYTPQYGYMQEEEKAIGKPLRMTFGLSRRIKNEGDGSLDHIRVARANLWVAHDPSSPDRSGLRIIKDINTYQELPDEEAANRYFTSPHRSQVRVGFVLNRIFESLD
jgi:hypothetical protein